MSLLNTYCIMHIQLHNGYKQIHEYKYNHRL